MSIIACTVDGCERERSGRMEVCSMHYKRMKRNGSYEKVKVRKSCTVENCASPAYGHGHCHMHYRRFKNHGSTDLPKRDLLSDSLCTIEGCDKPHFSGTLCSAHYTRKRRTGSPTTRYMGEVIDGKRICPHCRVDKPLEEYGKSQAYCRPCTSKKSVEWIKNHPRRAELQSKASLARRARIAGATIESFSREEILERDGWICGICDEPIDKTLQWPHLNYASIDHIIPLARGGEHSRKNVQAAHFRCNCSKKDSLPSS